MASTDDQDGEKVVITTLSAQVDEEIVLLSHANGAPEDDDIEVVEYEVTLNSLHRAIHVVRDADP